MSTNPRERPGRPDRERDLTPRQQQIQQVYRDSVQRRGRPPSLRKIGAEVDLASPSSVRYQLSVLEEMGSLPRLPSQGTRLPPSAQPDSRGWPERRRRGGGSRP